MTIGCITGNGVQAPVAGVYAYHAPGLACPLAPDLFPDSEPGSGPFPFSDGALTCASEAVVGWRGATTGEAGVDIVVRLGSRYFVDHVVVRTPSVASAAESAEPARPQAGNVEAMGHTEPEGLSEVRVFAVVSGTSHLRLVGRATTAEVTDAHCVTVTVGVETEELTVRLISDRRDIRLSDLEIWGSDPNEPRVFPVPAKMEIRSGAPFVLRDETEILIDPGADEGVHAAASLLREKIEEIHGVSATVTNTDRRTAPSIRIATPGESMRGDCVPATGRGAFDATEGYTLTVDSKEACIVAVDRRGLIYAAETLLQLLAPSESGIAAPACHVEDSPRLPFRGVHLFLPAREQIEYTKHLIRNLLVPMKLNTIFLELAGGMRFDRRPEISEAWERNNRLAAEGKAPPVPHGEVAGGGWLTKAEVKDLVDYARGFGIEVVPEIQSLSHVQYLTMTYPEIAEAPVEDGYADSYCPLHPKSREIVFDMIDEVVELLGPLRYLHMGHDEVYTMGECPRCTNVSRDELFARDIVAIYEHLKSKNVGMMIWADMLQPWQRYAGENAAALIPKDIVMLEFVWYFRTWADTEDLLLRNGFRVILGNCYSSHFTRYESRTDKAGVIGTQVSVWSATSEEEMGRLGKLYDLMYSANTAWSRLPRDELRWTFDRRIARLLSDFRRGLRGRKNRRAAAEGTRAQIDLTPHLTASRRDLTGAKGGYDLSGLPDSFPDGVILVEGSSIRDRTCPERVTVPIEAFAGILVFAHTCTGVGRFERSIGARVPIARYEIIYSDDAEEIVDVAYGHHVAEWNRRHGAPLAALFHRHAGYVATYPVDPLWQGKTASGEDVTVYSMEWTNPYPERKIRSVRIAALDGPTDASLVVVGISVVETADAPKI